VLLLLDLMFHSFTFFHSFCSTCCSSPLTWLVALFFLLDLLLRSSCSISLFLSNYYSTPLAWPLCSSTYLLHSWFWGSLFLLFNPVVLLLLFQIGTPPRRPFIFCKCEVWRSCPNPSFSKLSSSSQTWKVKTFVFNFCLLMNFFNYPCFWEMVVNNVFFIFMQELFGHCTFNYTHCISLLHIAFHLHNCIVYFFSTLFFLSFNCL